MEITHIETFCCFAVCSSSRCHSFHEAKRKNTMLKDAYLYAISVSSHIVCITK